MLNRNRQIRMQAQQVLDAGLFALSFWLACKLRSNTTIIDFLHLKVTEPFGWYIWQFLILIPAAPIILEAQGFYNRPYVSSRHRTAWLLFKGVLLTCLGLVLALFLAKMLIARWVVVWFGFIGFGLVFTKEEVIQQFRRHNLGLRPEPERLILVGADDETRQMALDLHAKSGSELVVVAHLDLNNAPVERLVELVHEHSPRGVIISAKHAYFEHVEEAIRACELQGVEAWLVADFFKTQISQASFDDFYGWPVLVFRSIPEKAWERLIKRAFDLTCSALALVLLSWFFALVALLVKLTSPGPVFFCQQRSGLNGRPFTLYKFRTMVTNAEQLKHELMAMNEMSGPVFKVTNDPRVTPIGRFLRKYSIDEFPQLYNVLRGEMSIVGPRPLPVDEVKRFSDLAHRRRLSVKPGLTCLWQISGRNNVSDFKDWVRLDLQYIDTWSLWLDLKICFQTIPIVLTGAGAR